MKELLVVGGGPAGLATSIQAARAGLDVTLWEKRAGTIDKACGEGLMPGAVTALTNLGVAPEGEPLTGIRYLSSRHSAEASFRHGPGRGVRRTALHEALRAAAADAGVLVQQRTAVDVQQRADRVVVDGEAFGHLVAADGLHSSVRRTLGLDGRPSAHRRYGLRRHYRVAPWTSYVEVYWNGSVEAYVTPVAPDVVGVAMLTSMRSTFENHLSRFPPLQARLRGAVPLAGVLGAGPLRQRASSQVAGRVLLVGDAAGYVDALTGEGVALALAQARAAAAAIVAAEPESYVAEWHRITRRYRVMTASLLAASRVGPVRRALVPTAERVPVIFSAAVNALARPA